MPDRPWKDEYTLLCEKCGYVVEGIAPDLPCPECGQKVGDSHPRKRSGSPWQRRRSFASLIRTWVLLMRRPRRCWDLMEIDHLSGTSLSIWGAILGFAFPAVLILLIATYALTVSADADTLVGSFFALIVSFGVFMAVAGIYAGLAVLRMEFWAKHRGYRITSKIAKTIIGHASFGLALIPFFVFAGILTMLSAGLVAYVGAKDMYDTTNAIPIALAFSGYFMILASIPGGLIVFEILSSLGFRRMRYRNTTRPQMPIHPTDTQPQSVVQWPPPAPINSPESLDEPTTDSNRTT